MEELANKIVEDVLAVLGFGEDHPDYQLCVDRVYQVLVSAQQSAEPTVSTYYAPRPPSPYGEE